MGFIRQLRENKYKGEFPQTGLFSFFPAISKTGVSVSESSALTCSAVLACVRVISETIASLPLFVYERLEKGKQKATNHPLYYILHTQPNAEMTSFQFRETLQMHLCLWGNAYAEIEWGGDGYVKNLWPIPPNRVNVRRNQNKEIVYDIFLPTGGIATLESFQVLHIRGLSPNGIMGYSPIALAREAIGLALATEEFGARFFSNDASPGGVIEHPGQLSDTAYERLVKFWKEKYQGLSNAHRVAILEEGMKWQSISIPAKDAQFLESRKFQVEEIARIFRVPPHLIGHLERATFSNIEHQGIEFVVHTIRPWLVRWEQELLCQLFLPKERERFFVEFVVDGLLRGDIESRYRAYATGRQWGWLSADDIRELENMNPLPDGKGEIYLIPLNMMPAPSLTKSQNKIDKRSIDLRRRIISSFSHSFSDAILRIIKREEADIMRFVKKNQDKKVIEDFIEKFYSTHNEYIEKVAGPVFLSFAEASSEIAVDMINGNKVDIENFVYEILSTWTGEHTFYSRNYLKNLIQKVDEKDIVNEFQRIFDEWKEKRVEKIKNHLLIRINNAVSLYVWKSNGISWKKWVSGENESPFCKNLNGKIISIDSVFFKKGDVVEDDEGKKVKLWRDVNHPPLVKNCFCLIEPVIP